MSILLGSVCNYAYLCAQKQFSWLYNNLYT